MEEHLVGRQVEANKAFFERLFYHMVGIINLVHRVKEISTNRAIAYQEIGTGTACKYHGKKIILTAKHVLEDAGPEELRFLPRVSGRIEWADEPIRTRSERVMLKIDRIALCEAEDLAAIVLAPDSPDLPYVQFLELPAKLAEAPEQGSCVVLGYPSDQNSVAEIRRDERGTVHNLCVKSDGFWGEITSTGRPLQGFDKDAHFLLKFFRTHEGARPEGYSGAGVWLPPPTAEPTELWTPDPRLVGVETHAYLNLGLLRVVKSRVVADFLEESFPALAAQTAD